MLVWGSPARGGESGGWGMVSRLAAIGLNIARYGTLSTATGWRAPNALPLRKSGRVFRPPVAGRDIGCAITGLLIGMRGGMARRDNE